jgi:hypothetical protein
VLSFLFFSHFLFLTRPAEQNKLRKWARNDTSRPTPTLSPSEGEDKRGGNDPDFGRVEELNSPYTAKGIPARQASTWLNFLVSVRTAEPGTRLLLSKRSFQLTTEVIS